MRKMLARRTDEVSQALDELVQLLCPGQLKRGAGAGTVARQIVATSRDFVPLRLKVCHPP